MRNAFHHRSLRTTTPERWQGFKDAKAGRSFCPEYETWCMPEQRNYERGRLDFFNISLAGLPLPKNPIVHRSIRRRADLLVGEAIPREFR